MPNGENSELSLRTTQNQEILMESIKITIASFIESLPPLLQLLLGIFVTIGVLKLLMSIVDYIEDRREGKR
jgi:hypothetical protein